MQFIKSTLLIISIVLANLGIANAHALYIDTNPQGSLGETHEVNVYYSEFAEGTVEQMPHWFSDVESFELWLVRPDGKRIQLKTTIKDKHVSASFTPQLTGVYRLEISHITAKVPKSTAFQFNAFAQVVVNTSKKNQVSASQTADFLLVNTKPTQKTSAQVFQVFLNGQPKAGVSATVFLPSGKTKEIKSNAKGLFKFKTKEEGVYFIEATIFQQYKTGKTTKDTYKSLWRCATQKFEI